MTAPPVISGLPAAPTKEPRESSSYRTDPGAYAAYQAVTDTLLGPGVVKFPRASWAKWRRAADSEGQPWAAICCHASFTLHDTGKAALAAAKDRKSWCTSCAKNEPPVIVLPDLPKAEAEPMPADKDEPAPEDIPLDAEPPAAVEPDLPATTEEFVAVVTNILSPKPKRTRKAS